MMRSYRFRLYPSKMQDKKMREHLWIEKNLWNALLEFVKKTYAESGKFPSKEELWEKSKNTGLYSQAAQQVVHRLCRSLMRFLQCRKQGKPVGFPRFKNFDRMKSLNYPESGFKLEEKLSVTPFGKINIRRHQELKGTVKTLAVKRESSGKWFAVLTSEQEPVAFAPNGGGAVGVDLGLKSFATLSDGAKILNPRFYQKEEFRLAALQRALSKRKKGGSNRNKSKSSVARLLERVTNARNDFLHKQSRFLVEKYGLIALEELPAQEMAEEKFGKQIHDASWSKFASMVRYKAESAGCRTVFVNPRGTTRQCSACGNEQEMPLSERTYECPRCGLVLDRDVNAARNILAKATVGTTERHAWGNETGVSSMNQEAAGNSSR